MFSPPVQNMLAREGYATHDGPQLDDFIGAHEHVALVFAEGMKRIPEADDLAVILPEIVKAFAGRFAVNVVPFPAHRDLKLRYRFLKVPTIVFLRNGDYLGAVSGLLDWADYLAQIDAILRAEPSEPPPMTLPGAPAGADALA